MRATEVPCPHCGQDLRLPAEANLEDWDALVALIAEMLAHYPVDRTGWFADWQRNARSLLVRTRSK